MSEIIEKTKNDELNSADINLTRANQLASASMADPNYVANRHHFEKGDIWLGRSLEVNDDPIGYINDKHIMVCAGSRSGKGRSFIVNNLALWQGSTVTYDPKGDLPQVLAARRGQGDDYCNGLGQDVYVLDPLNHSGVDENYLAYFDPLSGLDPDDRNFATFCKRIAASLVKIPDHGGESGEWAKRAVRYIALVIMHVMTSERVAEDQRTLRHVLRLVVQGEAETRKNIIKKIVTEQAKAKAEGREYNHKITDVPDAVRILFDFMADNLACRGHIAEEARNLIRTSENAPTYFESVRGEAADQLDWLKDHGIEISLTGVTGYDESDNAIRLPEKRRLDPDRLKTDPKGISVFIVMPVEDLQTYQPWLQVVFLGLFAAIRKTKGKPKTGHQVLMVLDEFSSLGYQDYIINSLDSIAGSGMKLMTIVQNFGVLQTLYKERKESFFTNSSIEIYFGKIGREATEYLTKELGEIEVSKVGYGTSQSESVSQSASKSVARGETQSHGGGESDSAGSSHTDSTGWNNSTNKSRNSSQNSSTNRGWNKNSNSSSNWNYEFAGLIPKTSNHGRSGGSGRSGGNTSGTSSGTSSGESRGNSGGQSNTTNKSHSTNSNWSEATSRTETETASESRANQRGDSTSQTFHKKPLLEPHEITTFLEAHDDRERDHPNYPGLALIRIEGKDPFFVRRSNYDQDDYFVGCFTPDVSFDFVPLGEQDILGHQVTDAHIVTFTIPNELLQAGFSAITSIRPTQKFDESSELFTITGSYKPDFERDERKPMVLCQPWNIRGRILDIADAETQQQTGEVLTVRLSTLWDVSQQRAAINAFFAEALRRTKAEIDDRKRREREAAERARLKSQKEEKRWQTIDLNQQKISTFRDRAFSPVYPIILSVALMLFIPFIEIGMRALGVSQYSFPIRAIGWVFDLANNTKTLGGLTIWYFINIPFYTAALYYLVIIGWLTGLRLENWKNLLESEKLDSSQKRQINKANISAIEDFAYQPWFIILLMILPFILINYSGLKNPSSIYFGYSASSHYLYLFMITAFPTFVICLPAYYFGFKRLLKNVENMLNEWMPKNYQHPPNKKQELIVN